MIFLQVNQRERIACPLNSKQYSITYSLNHIHIYLKNNGQLYNNLLIHGSMYRILNVYLYVQSKYKMQCIIVGFLWCTINFILFFPFFFQIDSNDFHINMAFVYSLLYSYCYKDSLEKHLKKCRKQQKDLPVNL